MTDYINEIISIIENLDDDYEYDNIKQLNNYVYESLLFVYPDFDKNLFKKVMNKLLKLTYVIDKDRDISISNLDKIKIPENKRELVEHVEYIANLPQPEQRTEEWFKMRENMLTASTAAQVIGKNPYPNQKPEDLIMEKVFGKEFIDNKYVHHGKKYEEVATMIYENIYNVKVDEYGLVPHPEYNYLGASPDGIATYKTLDNKFSEMIGTMLEIKCPYSRKIKTKGKINGGICPHYYWCQVQQQLECCDLDKCDFWQCQIVEYKDRNEWLMDEYTDNINTEEQNKEKLLLDTCKKGCVIQLQPINIKFDEFKSIYIYPDEVDMTCAEYDQWVLEILSNYHNSDKYKDYRFDRILYWKLVKSHNVTIERDTKWFSENLPKYKELWEKITHLKNNPKEAEELKKKMTKKSVTTFISSSSDSDGEYDDDE